MRARSEGKRQEGLFQTNSTTQQKVEVAVADEERLAAQFASRDADLVQARAMLRRNEMAAEAERRITANVNALRVSVDQEKFESVCEELSRRQQMVRCAGRHRSSDETIFQCYEFAHALYREMR